MAKSKKPSKSRGKAPKTALIGFMGAGKTTVGRRLAESSTQQRLLAGVAWSVVIAVGHGAKGSSALFVVARPKRMR